jgi:hypothetical protein
MDLTPAAPNPIPFLASPLKGEEHACHPQNEFFGSGCGSGFMPTSAALALALALLLSGGAAFAQDAPLGRLFFTPAERASMDLERLTGVAGAGGGASVKLNGIVRNRASGGSTVWLNGKPWHGADRLTGVSPSRSDPARARVTTADGSPVEVRVGQITDRASG